MKSTLKAQFIQFLENDLALSSACISAALGFQHEDFGLLPVMLWSQKLATLDEVSDMFDWLDNR